MTNRTLQSQLEFQRILGISPKGPTRFSSAPVVTALDKAFGLAGNGKPAVRHEAGASFFSVVGTGPTGTSRTRF